MPITENSGKKESEEAGAGEEHGSPALQADTLPSEPPGKSLHKDNCNWNSGVGGTSANLNNTVLSSMPEKGSARNCVNLGKH